MKARPCCQVLPACLNVRKLEESWGEFVLGRRCDVDDGAPARAKLPNLRLGRDREADGASDGMGWRAALGSEPIAGLPSSSMSDTSPLIVLDANIWVAERMLRTPLGGAALHAIVSAHGHIGLPEVVEREVLAVFLRDFDRVVSSLKKSSAWLSDNLGQPLSSMIATREAAEKSLRFRLAELSGALRRVPLELSHAQAALEKIIEKRPPCGQNNEQFRDCCIWSAALQLAEQYSVTLISADKAFFKGGAVESGLATNLVEEAKSLGRIIRVFSNLSDYLEAEGGPKLTFNDQAARKSIRAAVYPKAMELVLQHAPGFRLDNVQDIKITGFSSPDPSIIAISFKANYRLENAVSHGQQGTSAKLNIDGSMSWDPNTSTGAPLQVSGWHVSIDQPNGSRSTSWDSESEHRYDPENIRHI